MASNSIVHRYSKSFTSHDGCICCKRTLLDGIWEPTIKITLSANTAGAITAEFHARCVQEFVQSGRQWGWTPQFKRRESTDKYAARVFDKCIAPSFCEPTIFDVSVTGRTTDFSNVERGVFHRSTCIVTQKKNQEPAIKFHLTNGRDCIVRLTELEKLLASTPDPLACSPLKVIFAHRFFEKGTLEECHEKLKLLEVPDRQSKKMFRDITSVEECLKQVQGLVTGKGRFPALALFHGMHPTPIVENVPLKAILEESYPTPSILDLKEEVARTIPYFKDLGEKRIADHSVIKVLNGYWQDCPKLMLKFENWDRDFIHYGLNDLKVTIQPNERWSGSFDTLIDYLSKGYSSFVNGHCVDAGYIAEGLVSESNLVRQVATEFSRIANAN